MFHPSSFVILILRDYFNTASFFLIDNDEVSMPIKNVDLRDFQVLQLVDSFDVVNKSVWGSGIWHYENSEAKN